MQISALVLLLVAALFVTGSHSEPDGGCGCGGGSRNVALEVARVKREEPELRPGNCNCARCDAGKPCGCGCGNGGGKIGGELVPDEGRVKREDVAPEPVVVAPTEEPAYGRRRGGGRGGGGRGGGRGRYSPVTATPDNGELVAQPGFYRPVGRLRLRPRIPNPIF